MYSSGMLWNDKDIIACKQILLSIDALDFFTFYDLSYLTSILLPSLGSFQVITVTSLITFLWMVFGYSLAFAPATTNGHANEVYGNADRLWLRGMMTQTVHMLAPTIPEALFCAFQLCFAIFTAGLVCISFASRYKNLITIFCVFNSKTTTSFLIYTTHSNVELNTIR